MRSVTLKNGGGGNTAYDEGWHDFTIKTAKYLLNLFMKIIYKISYL